MKIDVAITNKIEKDYKTKVPVFGPTGKVEQVKREGGAIILTVADYLMEGHVRYMVTIMNDEITISGFGAPRDSYLTIHLKWVVNYYVSA